MASIVSIDELHQYEYESATSSDDVKAIRRECNTPEEWQGQLLRSLRQSGWTCGMLLYLPAALPLHWVLLLQYEFSFSLVKEQTTKATMASQICGTDRRLWMTLACKSLTARGWTPTMLSRAWDIPKTNIYRFLDTPIEVEAAKLMTPPDQDENADEHGSGTEKTNAETQRTEAV